ncbi:MAG: carbon storage regulator [Motiliproteus sp.]
MFLTCADGTEITVTVAAVKGNQVRLMIDAPLSVNIVRDDVKSLRKPVAA